MKRRVFALLCAALMLASLLAGCGGGTENTQKSAVKNTEASASSARKKVDDGTYTVYARASSDWGTLRLWAWSETEGELFAQWPGESLAKNTGDIYALRIPEIYDWVVISGKNGDIQTQDEFTDGNDIYFEIGEEDYEVHYNTAPDNVKPAPAADPDDVEPVATTAPADDNYIEMLDGNWESVHLNEGSFSLNVSAKVYDQTVYDCTQMTISMEVEMNAGTSCKDWQVWGRNGKNFVKLGKIYLPDGDGFTSQTLNFSKPVTFDAITITPTVPGGYSWSLGFVLTDIYTK